MKEELEKIKKELKKDLIKELGKDEMSGRFYMTAKQMELKTATIFIANIYKPDEIRYDRNHNEFTGKQLNEKSEETYSKIAKAVEKYQSKYNYTYVREDKEHSSNWSTLGELFIRLYFKGE